MSRSSTDLSSTHLEFLKAELLDRFESEHRTTMRVLRAIPESHFGFRPHERSATVMDIAATLAREQSGILAVLDGSWTMPPSFQAAPRTWSEAMAAVDAGGSDVIATLKRTPRAGSVNRYRSSRARAR